MSRKGNGLDAQTQSNPSTTTPSLPSQLLPYGAEGPPKPEHSPLAKYCARLPEASINSFCGAAGGVASGIVTCPLDVIKTRLQAQGSFRRRPAGVLGNGMLYHGMIGTAKTIWKEDGLRGMYRGLGPMLLGYLPTWAVYMTVYDESRERYNQYTGRATQLCSMARIANEIPQTTYGSRASTPPSQQEPARPSLQTQSGSSRPASWPKLVLTHPQKPRHPGAISQQWTPRGPCFARKAFESSIAVSRLPY